uniref:Ig-like domain-containing protein n=1 Tax=Sphenodon punctatus TaxID=8508 RepID=A0A8D0HD85_SPHPU
MCTATVTKSTVMPSSIEVMENSNFTLTCSVSQESGPVSIFWLKNGVNLTTSNTLQLSEENRTLTIVKVTRNDAGAYQCEPRNLLSYNRSDSINVTVFYGPDSAVIIPPGTITRLLGSPLTRTCRSEGVPELQYRWFHNGTESNRTGNILTIESTSWGDAGNYSCRVENPRTSITALNTVHLLLLEKNLPLLQVCLLDPSLASRSGRWLWWCWARLSSLSSISAAITISPERVRQPPRSMRTCPLESRKDQRPSLKAPLTPAPRTRRCSMETGLCMMS